MNQLVEVGAASFARIRGTRAAPRPSSFIDVYVELTLHGGAPELRYPGVAAHLRVCRPCAEDFEGLLVAVGGPAS